MPRTKSESSNEQDEKIKLVAEEGTQNILNAISNKCKLIFPSTHVVYEGIPEVKKDIKEDETTRPVLSYSLSKAANEKQLKESGKNYIILRLGSVYGYSNDTMRIDIMPNLFSKISSRLSVEVANSSNFSCNSLRISKLIWLDLFAIIDIAS